MNYYSFFVPVALIVSLLIDEVAPRPQNVVPVDPTFGSYMRTADMTGADLLSMMHRSIDDLYKFFWFSY